MKVGIDERLLGPLWLTLLAASSDILLHYTVTVFRESDFAKGAEGGGLLLG